MNTTPATDPLPPDDPLAPLLVDLFDGGLEPERFRALERLLHDDPAARRRYRRYVRVHTTLESELLHPQEQGPDGIPPAPSAATSGAITHAGATSPPPPARAGRRWRRFATVLALVVVVVVALGVLRSEPAPAAMVVAADGVRLQDGEAPVAGQPLAARTWSLAAGVLRLRLRLGATVAIRAPAVFAVTGGNAMALTSGTALAEVPPDAHGFRIATPQAQVIDLGTEFAVQVDAQSGTTIQVRRGRVEVGSAGAVAAQVVPAGEARAVDAAGTIANARFDAGLFADRPLAAATRPAPPDLRADPALVALFGGGPEADHADHWLAPVAAPAGAALIAHPVWVPGRSPGRQALAFQGPDDRIRLDVPGNFTALTLATWIRIHARTAEPIALCATDGWGAPPILHWLCETDGRLSLHLYSPSGRIWNWTSARPVPPPSDAWHHLAVTCSEDGLVRFYADGDLLGEQQQRHQVGFGIGPLELGNWRAFARPGTQRPSGRQLDGALDEFAILSRAWSSAEIRRLAEEGRP